MSAGRARPPARSPAEFPAGAVQAPRAALPDDAIAVGRMHGAWGVRGWVRVAPFNDARESLLLGQRHWWLRAPDGVRALEIEEARAHGDEIVAKAVGLDDRDAAASLDGAEVLIRRADFPPAASDEYYWVDLIGCTVRNPAGEVLGVVVGIDDHCAHPVMRLSDVAAPGASPVDRLIPFVPTYILEIDVEGRSILADWARDY